MPAQKAVSLGHLTEHLHRTPVEEPEISGVPDALELREAPEDAVEQADQREPPPGLARSRVAHRVNHVRALVPAAQEGPDQLGRVLKIGVDRDDHIPGRVIEPGGERRLVAEVPCEAHHPYPRVLLGKGAQPRDGLVGRAVVHGHQLPGDAVQRVAEPLVEGVHRLGLVEHRHDHA